MFADISGKFPNTLLLQDENIYSEFEKQQI